MCLQSGCVISHIPANQPLTLSILTSSRAGKQAAIMVVFPERGNVNMPVMVIMLT